MSESPNDTVQLLHSLGYLYGEYGHTQRSIVLLLLASRLDPENSAILYTLAHVFLRDKAAEDALTIIERIEQLGAETPVLTLLKSRALWIRGSKEDARRTFEDFIDLRTRGELQNA